MTHANLETILARLDSEERIGPHSHQDTSKPKLALFDADGTLWRGDIADLCTLWFMGRGIIEADPVAWARYGELFQRDPAQGCTALLSFYRDLPTAVIKREVALFWQYGPPLQPITGTLEVMQQLSQRGFLIWIVSGSPTLFLEPLTGLLPIDRILGNDFQVDGRGIVTGTLEGTPCAGAGKASKVRESWSGAVDFVAGNSVIDIEMMKMSSVALAVHPEPALEDEAMRNGWTVEPTPPHPPSTPELHPQPVVAPSWPTLEEGLQTMSSFLNIPDPLLGVLPRTR